MRTHARFAARAVLLALAALGVGVAVWRYGAGLGATTNLGDAWPWGLWIAFDVLCGVALAAGGFTVAAAVHVLGRARYRPVARPAILTAFLGYLLVLAALLVDLGQPQRIFHLMWMGNPDSVLFEVGWCLLLYTIVLGVEFAPVVLEKRGAPRLLAVLGAIQVPLVILGVGLSTLHQSSLGALFLVAPHRLGPLWFTPMLPVLFFLSAAAAGLAMVIVESTLSARVFGRSLEEDALRGLARAIPWVLAIGLAARLGDLVVSGGIAAVGEDASRSALFLAELAGGCVLPIVMLVSRRRRETPGPRFAAAVLVVAGVVLNRLDVALLGAVAPGGAAYSPRWTEFALTAGLVAIGLLAFGALVRRYDVFAIGAAPGRGRGSLPPVVGDGAARRLPEHRRAASRAR